MTDDKTVVAATDATSAAIWAVAIFAHNEERNIERCLDSVLAAGGAQRLECFVLANGCTDRTADIVARYAARSPAIRLVPIDVGDKANAWNEYVHRLAPAATVHFFVDGDCCVGAGALSELARSLAEHPLASLAAALPATGRHLVAARRAVVDGHELMGNLYAMRGDFIDRLRRTEVRLPVGLIGDDSLVGALAKWDLDAMRPWNVDRIVVAENATFSFESLSPWHFRDWQIYLARRIRYRVRAHQIEMLKPLLKAQGVAALPPHIRSLYAAYVRGAPRGGSGIDHLFDYLARRRIEREANPGS